MNPGSPSRVEPEAVEKHNGSMPEAVRYMLTCWAVMIGGELLHQIMAVVASVVDPSALREVAKERAKNSDGEVSDALMNASVYGSIFIMAVLQLGVILLFVFALRAVQKQAKWAENARRLLQIFSGFFALRMLTLFMMAPASTALPTAFFATTGVILSACYALWLYRKVVFGALVKPSLMSIKDLTFRECVTLFPLIALTILFGVYPKPVLDMSAASVQQLVNNYQTAVTAVKAAALTVQ